MKQISKMIFSAILILFALSATAQVGINNSDPKALLDVVAKKGTQPDGILIPRLTAAEVQAMDSKVGEEQNSMLVYVTQTATTALSGKCRNIDSEGFYYYDHKDGQVWKKLGAKGTEYTAGAGIEIGGGVVSATGLERIKNQSGDTGWRLIGRNPAHYLDIGKNAVDLSYGDFWNSEKRGASGDRSVAMGYNTTASGTTSTAMGYQTNSSGRNSTAMGYSTTASGDTSTAMGFRTTASGYNTTAMGDQTKASGFAATAMGYGTTATGHYSTAMGVFNKDYVDNLFSIGSGTQNAVRTDLKNAFVITITRHPSSKYPTESRVAINKDVADMSAGGAQLQVNGLIQSEDIGNYTDDSATKIVVADDKGIFKTINKSSIKGTTYTAGAGIEIAGGVISATGLERISEGGKTGWRLIGRDPNTYLGTGDGAVDLSVNTGSTKTGASGLNSVAMGIGTTASGNGSTAIGSGSTASGNASVAMGYQAKALKDADMALGWSTTASGGHSVAMGDQTQALGNNSTAMGQQTTASGTTSTAMGYQTKAPGNYSTAMGQGTTASGITSTAMGYQTKAIGLYSTAIGFQATASGTTSIAMGYQTKSPGGNSTAMGHTTTASGNFSTAMGRQTTASGEYSTAIGFQATASGTTSIAMGYQTKSPGRNSTAMGHTTTASGNFSTAMGQGTTASGITSTAMGYQTKAPGDYSTAMGYQATASGTTSIAMGYQTKAPGDNSVAIGHTTTASGNFSTAIGQETTASATTSTAMGYQTKALGDYSTAMGYVSTASGTTSFAMGYQTKAFGNNSIATGHTTTALGTYSTAMGLGTTASGEASTSMGKYNFENEDNLLSVGIGADDASRKNGFIITKDGKVGIGLNTIISNSPYKLLVNGYIISTGQQIYSDSRLKKDIQPLASGWQVVSQLRPVQYYWNDLAQKKRGQKDTQLQYGFIAQEVEKVLPNVVREVQEENHQSYKSINYTEIIPILTKTIQEQQAEIQQQKQYSQALEERIKALEAKLNK